ncbi:thioredoxin, partial [Enterobacter mori]
EAAGQLSLFTSPAVILYNKNKEMHRQARIIDFEDLEYRIKQLTEIED